MSQNFIATLVAAGMFVFLVLALIFLKKILAEQEEKLSSYLNTQAINERAGLLIIFLLGLCVSEGMFAGTIETAGKQMNVVARMLGHTVFSLIGLIMLIGLPDLLADWLDQLFDMIKKKRSTNAMDRGKTTRKEVMAFITTLVLILFMGSLGIWFPYANVLIIGRGLNESIYVELAYHQSFWFLPGNWFVNVQGIAHSLARENPQLFPGLKPNDHFRATDYMSYPMLASWRLFQAHIALAFTDGLIALKDRLLGLRESINRRSLNQRLTDQMSNDQLRNIMRNPKEPIDKLVKYTGFYRFSNERKRKVRILERIFLNLPDRSRTKLGGRMGSIIGKINNLDKELNSGSINQSVFDNKKNAIINIIDELFANTTSNGQGFGSGLSLRNDNRSGRGDRDGGRRRPRNRQKEEDDYAYEDEEDDEEDNYNDDYDEEDDEGN